MNDTQQDKDQYSTADNLSKRWSIHEKYSTNKLGFKNWIQQHYDIKDDYKILELGCGSGAMWTDYTHKIRNNTQLYMTDLSQGMLDACQNALGNKDGLIYNKVDIQNIPYDNDSFDIVIANMMLYHVPDLNKGLSEINRVLKENGTFYCATYGEHGITEFLEKVLMSLGVNADLNKNFTLQNGTEILNSYFGEINMELYEDSLAITEIDDFMDYIYTLPNINIVGEDYFEIKRILSSHEKDGVLNVPKEYGMFICHK